MKKILAVNDVDLYAKMLDLFYPNNSLGLDLHPVCSGEEAVETIRSGGSYDAILMNLEMGRMHGIYASQEIRSLGFKNPIIAWSCHDKEKWMQTCLDHGMNGFANTSGHPKILSRNILDELRRCRVL